MNPEDAFRAKEHLALWGAPNETHTRGSVGTAHTLVAQAPYARAQYSLGTRVLDQLFASQPERTPDDSIDEVSPSALAQSAARAVRTVPPFDEQNPDPAQLEKRLDILREVDGSPIGRDARVFTDRCRATVVAAFERLRLDVAAACCSRPATAAQMLAATQRMIREQNNRRCDEQILDQLDTLLRNLHNVRQFEDEVTPELFSKLQPTLLDAAFTVEAKAVADVASRVVAGVRQQLIPDFERYCKKLHQHAVDLQRTVTAVKDTLEQHERVVKARETELLSTVALLLPGGNENSTITAICQRLGCPDVDSLVHRLTEQFERLVRDRAATDFPDLDPNDHIAVLLTALPASTLAETILQAIHQHRPDENSLYQLLKIYGVADALNFLWQRAEPTCLLGGRDSELYSVSLDERATLRLPVARNRDDEVIRSELRQQFLERCKGGHIQEAGEDESEVTMHRFALGFPIAIEQANHALLYRMYHAAEAGHIPFLLDFVPDSEYGQLPVSYQLLYEKEPTNGTHHTASNTEPNPDD